VGIIISRSLKSEAEKEILNKEEAEKENPH
jgi:hypothetical protein